MALISIKVPHDTARLLATLDVPGDREEVGYMHVTLLFLEDASVDDVLKAIGSTYKVTTGAKPFVLKTRRISHFEGDGEKIPVICPIESPEVHDFQQALRRQFDIDGVNYSKKHPTYRPHVTLSYAGAPLEESVDQPLDPPLEWGAHGITLWAGEHGDESLACEFSLTMGKSATAAMRNCLRASMLTDKISKAG